MTARRDFLVELGTEELPPKSLFALADSFAEGITKGLDAAGLPHGSVERFATPRRLAVRVRRLAERQPDRSIERRGPPVKAAFDASGQPTRAAQAFADSCGVAVEALEKIETPKGEWLMYRGTEPGVATVELLPGIVQAALDGLPIAKRMRWGSGNAEFVRPAHWLLMLFGRERVPGQILGLEAGSVSYGHRFMAPRKIPIASPGVYPARLERRGKVIVNLDERRAMIREGVIAAARAAGGEAVIGDALLDEVTALVEWPVPLVGRFDPRFLELPDEVMVATLQDHQRYFPMRDARGKLMASFVTVANIDSTEPAQVVAGNERVVRPRLSDAEFFWTTDREQRLEARYEDLGRVTYQARLGSLRDKVDRVSRLAGMVASAVGGNPALAERAARLSKCDLLTGMVGEFPELQGVMGRYYALHDGEPDEVCEAMQEQYQPRFAGDELPATPSGMALAVADKLDTVTGIFAAGQKPTGNRDPFGLRRASLGLLRICIERQLDLDLQALIAAALAALPFDVAPETATEVYDYVMERLRAYYLEGDGGFTVTPEMFDAVLVARPGSPVDFDARLRALSQFLGLPDAQSLAAANKRIANILRKTDESVGEQVDAELLIDPAEQILAEQVDAMARRVEPEFAARRYTEALQQLAALRPAVDSFFDSVMVMADDAALRRNRLALLGRLRGLFMHAADLSRLPG
jgi:glycyl-tRNA synthetase beta chain